MHNHEIHILDDCLKQRDYNKLLRFRAKKYRNGQGASVFLSQHNNYDLFDIEILNFA